MASSVRFKRGFVHAVGDRVREPAWHAIVLPLTQVVLSLVCEAPHLSVETKKQVSIFMIV